MDGDKAESAAPTREMLRWKCHKQVWALKIARIEQAPADQERQHAGGDWLLFPEDAGYGPVCVGHDEYFNKHKPQVGGYYVVYDDGYKSYSPAKAFEEGYTQITAGAAGGWVGEATNFALGATEAKTRAICYFNGEDAFRAPHLMALAGSVPDPALRMITFCVLVLDSGFTVVGIAYCHDPAKWDEAIGKKAAYEDAVDQLFEMLAFKAKADAHAAR